MPQVMMSLISTTDGVVLNGTNNIVENNLISGITGLTAVWIRNLNNTIINNKIGTDVSGTLPLGNILGIYVESPFTRADNSIIQGNLISGTRFSAIQVGIPILTDDFVHDITITNNKIGVDISGTKVLGNGQNGIFIPGALGTIISGNVIAGSSQNGIFITELSNGTVITNNSIGTDSSGTLTKDNNVNSFGNGLDGIHLGIGQRPGYHNNYW